MPKTVETIQEQLAHAQSRLEHHEKSLEDTTPKKDAKWRSLNADIRQLKAQLKAAESRSPQDDGADGSDD